MKNEMMETNQTGFLALQDFDLADVMCAEMDGLSAAFERVKIPSGGGVMFEIPGENPEEPDTVSVFRCDPLSAFFECLLPKRISGWLQSTGLRQF